MTATHPARRSFKQQIITSIIKSHEDCIEETNITFFIIHTVHKSRSDLKLFVNRYLVLKKLCAEDTMKPLNLSDNPDDDEETLSFLPNDPPINITVSTTNNSDKRKKHHQHQHGDQNRNRKRRLYRKRQSTGFCLPWMIESILFMMIIASVVVIKVLYRAKVYGFDRKSNVDVQEWRDLKIKDIDQWCLNSDVADCKCSNPLTPMPRYNHYTWTHAFHQNVHAARNSRKDRSFRNLDVVFLGDSILEGFKGMKFGKEIPHKQNNKLIFESLFDVDKGGQLDGLILAIAGDKVSLKIHTNHYYKNTELSWLQCICSKNCSLHEI